MSIEDNRSLVRRYFEDAPDHPEIYDEILASTFRVRAIHHATINTAGEVPLAEGIRLERARFADLFGTEDQREGMAAFLEKRKPTWTGR